MKLTDPGNFVSSENGKSWSGWSWLFVLHFLILQLLAEYALYFNIPMSLREPLVADPASWGLLLAGIVGRFLLLFVIFGGVLWLLGKTYSVRRPLIFFGLVLLYLVSFLLYEHPEVLSVLEASRWLVLYLGHAVGPQWVHSVFCLILIFLNLSFFKNGTLSLQRWAAVILVNLALILYGFVIQDHISMSPSAAAVVTRSGLPNVVLLSAGSLKMNSMEQSLGDSSLTGRFWASAYKFPNLVTPAIDSLQATGAMITAKNPSRLELRSNPPSAAFDGNSFVDQSLLTEFKKQGYRLILVSDDVSLGYFAKSPLFDEIDVPEPRIMSYVGRSLLNNWVLFGLFDNPVGRWIFPEIKNRSFLISPHSTDFSRLLRDKISEIPSYAQPTLILAHTISILHAETSDISATGTPLVPPGSDPAESNESGERGSTESAETEGPIKPAEPPMTSFINATLEPVTKRLQDLGIADNTVFALYSPFVVTPSDLAFRASGIRVYHSDLVANSGEEHGGLWLRIPGMSGRKVEERVGLIDLLPTVMDFTLQKQPEGRDGQSLKASMLGRSLPERVYSTETGTWPFRSFSSLWRLISPWNKEVFTVDPKDGSLRVRASFESGVVLQKQRVVYRGDYKLLTFPTRLGMQLFLCNTREDKACRKNILNLEPAVTSTMLADLDRVYSEDIRQFLFPATSSLEVRRSGRFVFPESSLTAWTGLYQGIQLMEKWHDYPDGIAVLNKVIDAPDSDESPKNVAKKYLGDLCSSQGIFSTKSYPHFISKLDLDHRIQGFDGDLYNDLLKYGPCLEVAGQRIAYQKYLKIDEIQQHRKKRYWAAKYLRPEPFDIEKILTNIINRTPESPKYLHLIGTPAFAAAHPKVYEALQIVGTSERDYHEITAQIDKVFQTELDYNLMDKLFPYYFFQYTLIAKYSPDEAILWLADQIVHRDVPLQVFNFFLARIDDLADAMSLNIHPSELRGGLREVPAQFRPFPLRDYEVGLSLVFLRKHYCDLQTSETLCQKASALEAENPEAPNMQKIFGFFTAREFRKKVDQAKAEGSLSPALYWLLLQVPHQETSQ